MQENHKDLIEKIFLKQFDQKPEKVERMKVGIDNEVYLVSLNKTSYIVRLNERNSLKGSSRFIPIFKSKGIAVPDIIAEDYSKVLIPYNWQILTCLPGTDIGNVIAGLTNEQLSDIAKEISNISKKLSTILTNGMYGFVGDTEEKLKIKLIDVINEAILTIEERNEETGVIKREYIEKLKEVIKKNELYINEVKSQFYYDDMSSKNVMVDNGKFVGLVDLDGIAYGDPLEAIGRIKASWYGKDYSTFYSNAVMDNLGLNKEQREIVTMWALFNRIYWQSEIGIYFNRNTSTNINQTRVEEGNKDIEGLIREVET